MCKKIWQIFVEDAQRFAAKIKVFEVCIFKIQIASEPRNNCQIKEIGSRVYKMLCRKPQKTQDLPDKNVARVGFYRFLGFLCKNADKNGRFYFSKTRLDSSEEKPRACLSKLFMVGFYVDIFARVCYYNIVKT